MIKEFGTKATEDIYNGITSKKAKEVPNNIHKITCRQLDMINSAFVLEDLKIPPGNRLEKLKGDLKGKYSIRINDQFRIIFEFRDVNAYQVKIVDYH